MKRFFILPLLLTFLFTVSCDKGAAYPEKTVNNFKSGMCSNNVIADFKILEDACFSEKATEELCRNGSAEFLKIYPKINCSIKVEVLDEETDEAETVIEKITPKVIKEMGNGMALEVDGIQPEVEVIEENSEIEI